MTPAFLADKIERNLKLHEGLAVDFQMVLTPDAAWGFVAALRKIDELAEEVTRLKTEKAVQAAGRSNDR